MPKKPDMKCYFGCAVDGPLHRFPKWVYPHEEKFNSWKAILNPSTQEKDNEYIYNNVRICYRHFEKCFQLPSHQLTKNAVPTLRTTLTDNLQEQAVSITATTSPTIAQETALISTQNEAILPTAASTSFLSSESTQQAASYPAITEKVTDSVSEQRIKTSDSSSTTVTHKHKSRDQPRCACYKASQEFHKVLDLKDGGLAVYCYSKNQRNVTKGGVVGPSTPTSDDVFILENTKDAKLTTSDLAPALERKDISCPRCRLLFDRAQELLHNVKSIDQKNVIGICDHCHLKALSKKICHECQDVVKKFVAIKLKENTKKCIKLWLSKMKNLIKDDSMLYKAKKAKSRAFSDIDINQLCQCSDRSIREPEVQQLYADMHKSDSNLYVKIRDAIKISDAKNQQGLRKSVIFTENVEPLDTPFAVYSRDLIGTMGQGPSFLPSDTDENYDESAINIKGAMKKKHDLNLRHMIRREISEISKIAPWDKKATTQLTSSMNDIQDRLSVPLKTASYVSPKVSGKEHYSDDDSKDVKAKTKRKHDTTPKSDMELKDVSGDSKKFEHIKSKQRSRTERPDLSDDEVKLHQNIPRLTHDMEKPGQLLKKTPVKRDIHNKPNTYFFPKKSVKEFKKLNIEPSSQLIKSTKEKFRQKAEIEKKQKEEKHKLKLEEAAKKKKTTETEEKTKLSADETKQRQQHTAQEDEKLLQKSEDAKSKKQKSTKESEEKTETEVTKETVITKKGMKSKSRQIDLNDEPNKELKTSEKIIKDSLSEPGAKEFVDGLPDKGKKSKSGAIKEPAKKKYDTIKEKREPPEAKDVDDLREEKRIKQKAVEDGRAHEREYAKLRAELTKQKAEDLKMKAIKMKQEQDEKKARELADLKTKEDRKQSKKSSKEAKSVIKSKPTQPVKDESIDEQEKPKEIELKMHEVKMRRPSPDDLILRLVKIRQANTVRKLLMPSKLDLKMLEAHKHHIGCESSSCDLCHNSDLEFDLESLLQKKEQKVPEIIIGEKIYPYRSPYVENIEEKQVIPLLFQSFIKEDTAQEPVEPPLNIEIPVSEKPDINRLNLTTKNLKEVDPELTKGVVRYALSDRTFIEKGWTMLPTEKVVRKMNVYRMRPAHPEFDWFEHNKNKRLMTYDCGEKLAEFDDNGRGRWYYRNGRLALDYYDAEETNAHQRYVIYSSGEPDERGRTHPITILATFDYLGNGIVFDHAGKIRLKYNQTEGVVLDRGIGPVSHWKWHTLNDPPVLQQVMIDTQMSHKDPEILKLGTAADNKTRPDNEEMLAIEFDNFIKEKSKKLSQKFKPFQIKMKALKINEHFSLRVLDQATIYLIFRDGSTNLKLSIGMILDHQEIVDTDTAEVGEVSNNLERFPARTDSLAGLQRSIAYAQRYERQRTERERKLRRPEPCSSADQLTAAASPPLRPPVGTMPTGSTSSAGYCKCRKPTNNLYYNTRLV